MCLKNLLIVCLILSASKCDEEDLKQVNEILKDRTVVANLVNCLMEQGPCSALDDKFKSKYK